MKNRRGFTLIELVVILGILSIVLSLLFPPVISSFKHFGVQNERTNTISDARTAMDYLTRQIRKSDEIEVSNNTITMDSVVYRLENRTLLRNDAAVIKGIDDLKINKSGSKIDIEIVIKDSSHNDYKLSSSIFIR